MNQLALIADVHANVEALSAVLEEVDRIAPEARLVCAGDIVGYGPDPEACIDLLRERDALCVMGNHDEMVLGRRDFSRCIHAGIRAAMWTRKRLADDAWRFLEALPASREVMPGVVVCHGDLESADTYISDADRAATAIEQLQSGWPSARALICAHTHHAALYAPSSGFTPISPPAHFSLPTDEPAIINPGAVGQSRDTRPLARFAILDVEEGVASFHELAYDHETTIRKLKRARLSPQVVLRRPRGKISQRVEWYRTRWARYRAERAE